MHSRFRRNVISGLLAVSLAVSAVGAMAQRGGVVFVTPIPNAPFSAVVQFERTTVRPDGQIALRSEAVIARDSQGRIRNELRAMVPVAQTEAPALLSVHLYDPVTRISTQLNPRNALYWTTTVDRPPATEPPDFQASPAGRSLPENEFTREEDLGSREIAGLPARGVRHTQTIPADASGLQRDIVVTDEYWYSDDLHINLMRRHNDPRTGSVTMTVTNVSRTEPDRSFFEVPANYKPGSPDAEQ